MPNIDYCLRNSFTETIVEATLTINNLIECSAPIWASILRLVKRHIDLQLSDRANVLDNVNVLRKCTFQGYYYITNRSLDFLLAVKPWRFTALQERRKNIVIIILKISVNHFQERSSKILTVIDIMQKLTHDKEIAESIHTLAYRCKPVELDHIYGIIKRLKNIKKLCANILEHELEATNFCQAINRLERLRSLELYDEESWTSAPSILLRKLKLGRVIMDMERPERLRVSMTTGYAYRKLTILIPNKASANKLIQFVKACPNLEHLTVDTCGGIQLDPLMPPNLITFEVFGCGRVLPRFHAPLRQAELKHLFLERTELDWPIMSAQCPNIRDLHMMTVFIRGCVTGLPLTALSMMFPDRTREDVLPRRMCTGTLLFFRYDTGYNYHTRNFKDWISHPEFLAGCTILLRKRKKRFSQKRLILFLKKTIVGKYQLEDQ